MRALNHSGFKLGVIMLDTRFPRIVGDPGNTATYRHPVVFKVVKKATVDRVVRNRIDEALMDDFVKAARELEAEEVDAITTGCGFLVLLQRRLSEVVRVPVFTSPLLLVPIAATTTAKPVGILTADSTSLTEAHLREAGVRGSETLYIKGLQDMPEFRRVILEDSSDMNLESMRSNVLMAAKELVREHPEVGSIVCECTNLTPFRNEIKEATRRPVYDYKTLVELAISGWAPSFKPISP